MRTACVYHSRDLDGWMSAAIVKCFWKNTTTWAGDTLHFIGYDYGQPIPDLSEYNRIIMCDVSFPMDTMKKLIEKLDFSDFIWIDHHHSAIKEYENMLDRLMGKQKGTYRLKNRGAFGFRDTQLAACELTWKYFFPNEEVPEMVRLLGMYDSFRSKGSDEHQKVLEFQYGARQVITNYEEAYHALYMSLSPNPEHYLDTIFIAGRAIYQYLCTEAEQTYRKGFIWNLSVMDSNYKITECKFICFNKERFNPINFGIDYHKDGYNGAACFWYDTDHWVFSLYNDNGEVDCSEIAKHFGGGGHKGAAGFTLKDLSGTFCEHIVRG